MNTPNHAQKIRIQNDLWDWFAENKTPEPWRQDRNMRYYSTTSSGVYRLFHWNTLIAEIKRSAWTTDHDLYLTYFDARYISSTTRAFQGRILAALSQASRAFAPGTALDIIHIQEELRKPTQDRDALAFDGA